jgi:hypothetical protein
MRRLSSPAVLAIWVGSLAAVAGGCKHQAASTPAPVAAPSASAAVPVVPTAAADVGIGERDFLYCGEWQTDRPGEHMYLVRGGKVVWTHEIGDKEELGDCTMASNGHVFFVRKGRGASEIIPDLASGKGGQIVWDYAGGGPGTEVHSVQPVGDKQVWVSQNGTPPRFMLFDKSNPEPIRSLTFEAGPKVHGQFRHVRVTAAGTFVVAHLNLGKVSEYAADGKTVLFTTPAPSPWALVKLKNGNYLISGNQHKYVREVNPKGEIVWELTEKDVDFPIFTIQETMRRANGNTVVNSWISTHDRPRPQWPGTVQVFEVTPQKKVVWKLSAWDKPNLGPGSCTQLLDEPGIPEKPGDVMR